MLRKNWKGCKSCHLWVKYYTFFFLLEKIDVKNTNDKKTQVQCAGNLSSRMTFLIPGAYEQHLFQWLLFRVVFFYEWAAGWRIRVSRAPWNSHDFSNHETGVRARRFILRRFGSVVNVFGDSRQRKLRKNRALWHPVAKKSRQTVSIWRRGEFWHFLLLR